MTDERTTRSVMQAIAFKVGFPLLIGLISLVAAHLSGMRVGNSLQLAAVVGFGVAFIFFIVDNELRISAVGERVTAGFTQVGRLAELAGLMERSSLGPALLTEFLEAISQVDGRVNPMLQRVARQEVERVTAFARQVHVGGEIFYDGEDRDWMLGLTQQAEASIDAISLSTVDAGVRGLDGGLWTSDLGIRYLDGQRKAIARKVRIRRIFVFEDQQLANDDSVYRITKMQSDAGVEVRRLAHQLIPRYLQSMIFDFILFDGVVSYEATPATSYTAGLPRPGTLRTRLVPEPTRVRDLEQRFEQLWELADPERQLDE